MVFFTQHLVLCESLRVWSSKSQCIIGLGPVFGLEKKLRWSISLSTLDCGGKVFPIRNFLPETWVSKAL